MGLPGALQVKGLPKPKPEAKVDVYGTSPEVILPAPPGFAGCTPKHLEVNEPAGWMPKLFGTW